LIVALGNRGIASDRKYECKEGRTVVSIIPEK